jgi:hypothetical protein
MHMLSDATSTSQPQPASTSFTSSGMPTPPVLHHTGAIVGGAIGGTLGVLALGAIFHWARQRRCRRGHAAVYVAPHSEPHIEPFFERAFASASSAKRARGAATNVGSNPEEGWRPMATVSGELNTAQRFVALSEERAQAPESERVDDEEPPTYSQAVTRD